MIRGYEKVEAGEPSWSSVGDAKCMIPGVWEPVIGPVTVDYGVDSGRHKALAIDEWPVI